MRPFAEHGAVAASESVLRQLRVSIGRSVTQHVILEPDPPLVLGDAGKDRVEQRLKTVRQDVIVVVLPFAARFDQARHAQQRQVMADGRLALIQQLAQARTCNSRSCVR